MQKQPPQQQQRLVATNTKQVLSSSFTHNAKEVRNSGGALLAANQIAIPGQRSAQNTSEAVVVRAPVSQFTVNGGRTEMVVRETIEPTTVIVDEKQVGGFVVQPPQMVVQPPPIIIQPPNVMVQQTGFEVQADTTSLPFTRDPGSIVVQYPRTLSNYLNPSAVSYTYGQMHTRVRHVPGNRPARTEARIRSVSNAGNGIYRLRLWASETRTDQTDCPIVFINRTQFGGAVQTGWANNSVDGNAYDGNNSVQSSAASNDYIAALQHTVTVGPNWSSAMMVPGTYLVWVRASFAAGTAAAGITIANGPTSLPYGPFTATLVAGAYIYVPMGQVTLPLTGVRPAGGGYTFTLTVNCQRPTSGTNYVDGTLWMLVDEENPPLSYLQIATNVIANTQQIETYSESRPDTFRVTQSGAVDAAWDCTQAGGVPRLFGGSDTRLWLSTDYNSSGAPANGRSDTTSLDLWLAPRYRTPG